MSNAGSPQEVLHYLAESLLPLCEHARITAAEPLAAPAGGCTSTTVAEQVTCPACKEWLHA